MDTRNPLSVRVAAITHLALVLSSLVTVAVFWFVRGRVAIPLSAPSRQLLSYLAYALVPAVVLITSVLKRGLPTLDRGDPDVWWAEVGVRGRVMGIWMVGEAACMAGAAFWFLTGNQLVLLSLAGAGLLVLATYRPSKLFASM